MTEKTENLSKGKYILSTILTLVVLTASVYFILNDDVRIDIENTRSIFKVKEDGKWVISGIEYVNLYDGTAKMRAKSRSLVTEIFEQNGTNMSKVTRTANYKNDITVIEEYLFNANYSDVELFPVSHSIRVLNAKTAQQEVAKNTEYILEYRVTDLLYYGETASGIDSPHEFGYNMKVEWEDGNYYSKVEKLKNQDKANLIIKYRLSSDDYNRSVRLFDPILDADGVFNELLYNDGGLINGEAIYLMNSPVDLEVKDLYHTYFLEKGNGINRWEVYIEKNIGYEVPTYEEIETKVEVSEVSNITGMNETKLVNVTTWVENGTTIEYRPEWVLLDYNDIITKGVHKIRLLGFYEKIGHNKIDWYPNIYLDKDKYNLPRNMYGVIESKDLQQSKWAWWDSNWEFKRQINLTSNVGNFSYLETINYSAGMQTDFDDLRFINSDENTELNFTIESKNNGVNATIRVNSLGANQIYMYYGNDAVSSTSSASNTHFNPVSMYYLDGNAYDSLGVNNGTISGASLTTGKIGTAYDFELSENDYIGLGTGTSLDIRQNITVSVWVKLESNPEFSVIASKDCGTILRCNQWRLVVDSTKNFGFERASSLSSDNFMTSNVSVSTGVWYNIVGVGNSTHNALYVNGNLAGIVSYSGNLYTTTQQTLIGQRGNGNKFDGIVDEFIIYNRTLTSDEIYKLYTYTAPTYIIGEQQQNAGTISIDYVTPPTPIDNLNTTQRYIPVEVVIDSLDVEFKNITYNFYKNGVFNESMTFYTEVTFVNKTNLQNDTWQYNVTVCGEYEDGSGICKSTPTRTINIYITPYIYVGGDTGRVKKYDDFFNLITEGPDHDSIYVIATDDNYIYYGGYGGYVNKAYKNNLSTIASNGDTFWEIHSITIDDDYVYYGAGFLGRYIKKVYKGNFTTATSSEFLGGVPYSIALDDDYIYFIENKIVQKTHKSNLSAIVSTPNYGGTINSIVVDDDYVYYGGKTTQTVRKAYKVNLTTIADSPNYGGTINSIVVDDDYVYYGGDTTQTVRKAHKNNLSTIADSPNYGGTINSIVVDDDYVYYGGDTTQTVRKAHKNNLSTIADSPNYGGNIGSIAIDPIPTLKFKNISPIDNFFKIGSNEVTFTVNITDGSLLGVKNVSLIINNTLVQINTSKKSGIYNFQEILDDGYYEWKFVIYDNNEDYMQMYETELRYLTVDTTPPVIDITEPEEDVEIYPNEEIITFKYDIYDEVTNLDTCILEYMNENKTIPCDGTNNANKLGNTTINTAQLTNATTTTFVRIDTINVDQSSPYISNASSELMSSSASYGKEIRIDIVYNNGTTVSQTNSTTSTSYVLMNFENPSPNESVKEVQFWGREISTSGTFYSQNRGIRYSEAPFVITYLYPNNNVIFYANDTLGNMGSRNFILTLFVNPSVTLVSPADELIGAIGLEYDFIGTASVSLSDYTNLSNSTLYIWDNLGGLYYTETLDIELDDEFPETAGVSHLYTFDFQGDYPWNILVCDELGACVFAENNYSIEIISPVITSFTINGQTEDFDVELGAPIDLFATIDAGNITFDLDSPEYGKDLNNSYLESTFTATVMSFVKKTFANGVTSLFFENTNFFTPNTLNLSIHKYDIIDDIYFNISSDENSNSRTPIVFSKANRSIYSEYLEFEDAIDIMFFGKLIGNKIYMDSMSNDIYPENLDTSVNTTFETPGNAYPKFLFNKYIDILDFKFKMSGYKYGFKSTDNYSTDEFFDYDKSTARQSGGIIVPGGNNPKNFTYDVFNNEIDMSKWYGLLENRDYKDREGGYLVNVNNYETNNKISFNFNHFYPQSDYAEQINQTVSLDPYRLNIIAPERIDIGFNFTIRKMSVYGRDATICGTENSIYIGNKLVFSAPTNVCYDGYWKEGCAEWTNSTDVLNIALIRETDKWRVRISGVAIANGDMNPTSSDTCGRVNIIYNYTAGWKYSSVSSMSDPGCASRYPKNETLSNTWYINIDDPLEDSTIRPYLKNSGRRDRCYIINNNTMNIFYVNQTLLNITNTSYYSKQIFESPVDISYIDYSLGYAMFGPEIDIHPYLSTNNGNDWSSADVLGPDDEQRFVIDEPGTSVKHRIDFSVENEGYYALLPFIYNSSMGVEESYPANISIDLDGDGVDDFMIIGELNETTSPISITMSNIKINKEASTKFEYGNLVAYPIKITSDTAGIIEIHDINTSYNPNPVIINKSLVEQYVSNTDSGGQITVPIEVSSHNLNLTIDDLHINYAGGNYTYDVTARTPNNLVKQIIGINYFFTMWNYMFGPPNINSLEFVPINPTSKNVSAYGQTSTRPIIVLTNYGYHDKNASVMLRLSGVENPEEPDSSCVNLTVSATNNKSQGIILNTTYQELVNDSKFLDETNLWMWADYDCNYGTWRNWEPNFYIKYCCEGCLCSD